jgi:hypothetical protein
MDVSSVFPLIDPPVRVPWGISEAELKNLVGPRLRHVTDGYYTAACTSLPGLTHVVGFHFEPRKSGRLIELEFFRESYVDLATSYVQFQRAFEAHFGPPTKSRPGDAELPNCEWTIDSVIIRHFVLERFGPEEHMRVRHPLV